MHNRSEEGAGRSSTQHMEGGSSEPMSGEDQDDDPSHDDEPSSAIDYCANRTVTLCDMLDPSHADEPSSAIHSCASRTASSLRACVLWFASERRKHTQIASRMCEGTTGGWVVEVKPLAAKEKIDPICYSEYTDLLNI